MGISEVCLVLVAWFAFAGMVYAAYGYEIAKAILAELKVSNDAFRPPEFDIEARRKMAEKGWAKGDRT